MNVVIIFAASILTVFVAGHLARRNFTRADMALGIMAGILGLGLEQLLVSENLATSNLGLPLVAAIVVALGLASQRRGATER